jgi:hypothetical protein
VREALPRALRALAAGLEIILRDYPEGTDRREETAVGSIQLVGPISFRVSNELPLGAAGQVEFAKEDITRIVGAAVVPIVPASAPAEVASPRVIAFARVVVSRIVELPHKPLRSPVSSAASGGAMNRGVVSGSRGLSQTDSVSCRAVPVVP